MVKQVKADKSNMLKSLFLKEIILCALSLSHLWIHFLEIIATRFIF